MGLYNFQPRFVRPIESGLKTQTIRALRRHPDRPGSTMHLFTGLRQRGARLIRRVTCVEVRSIEITADCRVIVDGVALGPDECEVLARSDGFASFKEMMRFWDGRRPFLGHILYWGAA